MDFFESQELARRKTKWLVFYFILALVTMIAGIYFVVIVATQVTHDRVATGSVAPPAWFDPLILAGVCVVVLSIVGCGSLYKISSLRGGGESIAAMLGGRYLPPNSGDPAERRILNIVEEMALAAGTPVPPVYILDDEHGINAFAAGYTVDDAVIGINRGTLEQLSRDELQGVVAHEFSHVLNGDMRMSIRMIGILHGIQVLALIGLYVLRGSALSGRRSSDKGGGGYIILIAIGVIVIGWAGLFFARLIKAAVSRQREYLADASAVQFTRNPEGIAGALKMIGANVDGSVMHHPQAEEMSHMYFGSMFRGGFSLFATHPPLDKRIGKLDPRFDGDYAEYQQQRLEKKQRREAARKKQEKEKASAGFPHVTERIGFPGIMGDQFPIDPVILVAGIGLPDDDDVEYSELLVDRIPEVLAEAARDIFAARCIV
ncbi:MAG: M48 family metalloprotease, partial [Pirellulaceae bacterium]